nr:Deoxyribonuclease TatD [Candidatus Pantoea persica]
MAGVHPHHASEWSQETANTLCRLAERPQVVAIGECGLDFNRNLSAHEQQEYAFDAQLALAAELNMPVFLHCRKAHARFAARAVALAAEAAGRGGALLYRHA